MNKNVLVGIVVVLALGAGYYLFTSSGQPVVPATPVTQTEATQPTPQPAAATPATTAAKTVTVTYTSTGFSPKTVTVNKGDTVTFVAGPGSDEMWIASNPHPTHQGYDGTTKSQHCAAGYTGPAPLDQCSAGASFSFVFDKVGTWGYHNHGNASDGGTVIVQ